MPRLSHNEVILSGAMSNLQKAWQETAAVWADQARSEFEKAYIDELVPAVKRAIGAANEVKELLERAIRECS